MWKPMRSILEKHKAHQGCSFWVPLVVAVLSLSTMPESDLECAVWFELWHPLWPYGRAQVGSKFLLSPEVQEARWVPAGSKPPVSRWTIWDTRKFELRARYLNGVEKSELSVHDIRRKNSIRHEAETPQAESDETFQHTTIIFQKEPDPFFHPVLHTVSWVISIPGEGCVEGNIPSLEENISLHRGFTNLEKIFHVDHGEDFI